MKYGNIPLITLTLLGFCFSAHANPSLDQYLKQFDEMSAKLGSLEGRFTQVKTLSLFASKITSTGVVKMQPPGKLFWETNPPDSSTIIVNGDKTSFKVPKSKPEILTLSKSPKLKFILEHLVPGFGPPLSEWKNDFDIELVEGKDPEKVRVKLTPKAKVSKGVASWIKQIEIILNTTAGYPHAITLKDSEDDLTELIFRWKTSEKKLSERIFAIKNS